MINGYFLKHPDATKEYEIEFTNDIPENDFIGDYTLTAVNAAGNDVLITDEISISAVFGTNSITITASGGVDGENYTITVRVSLDLSVTTPVRIIEMRVRSKDVG